MLHKGLPREGVPQLGSEERAAQPRRFPASQDIGRSSVDLLPQDMAAQLSPALTPTHNLNVRLRWNTEQGRRDTGGGGCAGAWEGGRRPRLWRAPD